MTITIYGAGAIGGCAGAFMARAGEDVLMVDRVAEHVDAMKRDGLKITGFSNIVAPVKACLPGDLKGPLGLTFLAVKAMATDEALDVLAPLVGPETIVVSLQNGLNPLQIAARIGAEKTIATFINYGADYQGPGHIEHGGHGAIYVGELDGRMTDRLRHVHALLENMQPAHMTDNVFGYLWSKVTWACGLFAQAVTNETTADIMGDKKYQKLMIALCGEGVRVALDAGIRLEDFDCYEPNRMLPKTEAELAEAMAVMDRISARNKGRVKSRTGVWRDLAVRRRKTEIDHQPGFLVAEGERRGIDLPLNRRLVQIIKEIEDGKREQGIENVEELEKLRQETYGNWVGPR